MAGNYTSAHRFIIAFISEPVEGAPETPNVIH